MKKQIVTLILSGFLIGCADPKPVDCESDVIKNAMFESIDLKPINGDSIYDEYEFSFPVSIDSLKELAETNKRFILYSDGNYTPLYEASNQNKRVCGLRVKMKDTDGMTINFYQFVTKNSVERIGAEVVD